jgi:hypothetical protein
LSCRSVAEPDVKAVIPPPTWDEHVALMEMALDVGAIAQAVAEVRVPGEPRGR